jgi:hypothetical protein
MSHIQRLPRGPLAIIGDVHGELSALNALLARLDNDHPDHHIVFLGDLADRGPDSPGVIRRVRERMALGAQCVLGNHELLVIRGKDKGYNRWFFTAGGHWEPKETEGQVVPMKPLSSSSQDDVAAFFASLPIALERDDLRIVHACWDIRAIAHVRASSRSALEIFDSSPKNQLREPKANKVDKGNGPATRDEAWETQEMRQQNENPVAVLTSGKECPADLSRGDKIVWGGNKWRPLVRQRWWEEYDDDTPVVIGHYSRKWDPRPQDEKTALMFPGAQHAGAPVGLRKNVYCIDYGIGSRFEERHNKPKSSNFAGRLAALLWKNDQSPRLLFDDGSIEET